VLAALLWSGRPPINVVLAPIPRDGLAKRLRAIGPPALGVLGRRVPVRARVAAGPIGLGTLERERRGEVLAADAVSRFANNQRDGFRLGDDLFLRHAPQLWLLHAPLASAALRLLVGTRVVSIVTLQRGRVDINKETHALRVRDMADGFDYPTQRPVHRRVLIQAGGWGRNVTALVLGQDLDPAHEARTVFGRDRERAPRLEPDLHRLRDRRSVHRDISFVSPLQNVVQGEPAPRGHLGGDDHRRRVPPALQRRHEVVTEIGGQERAPILQLEGDRSSHGVCDDHGDFEPGKKLLHDLFADAVLQRAKFDAVASGGLHRRSGEARGGHGNRLRGPDIRFLGR